MFLHLSVILFTGGVCQCPLDRHHWADTQTPLGTPPGHTHPLSRHLPAQCILEYTSLLPIACWDTPPTAKCIGYCQQAFGTHPAGMYFCSVMKSDFGCCQSHDRGSNFERLVVISVQFSRNTCQIIGYCPLPTSPPHHLSWCRKWQIQGGTKDILPLPTLVYSVHFFELVAPVWKILDAPLIGVSYQSSGSVTSKYSQFLPPANEVGGR